MKTTNGLRWRHCWCCRRPSWTWASSDSQMAVLRNIEITTTTSFPAAQGFAVHDREAPHPRRSLRHKAARVTISHHVQGDPPRAAKYPVPFGVTSFVNVHAENGPTTLRLTLRLTCHENEPYLAPNVQSHAMNSKRILHSFPSSWERLPLAFRLEFFFLVSFETRINPMLRPKIALLIFPL